MEVTKKTKSRIVGAVFCFAVLAAVFIPAVMAGDSVIVMVFSAVLLGGYGALDIYEYLEAETLRFEEGMILYIRWGQVQKYTLEDLGIQHKKRGRDTLIFHLARSGKRPLWISFDSHDKGYADVLKGLQNAGLLQK